MSDVLKMKEDRSELVLEIVLRGGSPWGFTLVGGDEYDRPLTIAAVGRLLISQSFCRIRPV